MNNPKSHFMNIRDEWRMFEVYECSLMLDKSLGDR